MAAERKETNPLIPFLIIGAAVGVAYLFSIKRVVKAAKELQYVITRIQIYRFKLTSPIVFRVWVEFTNLEKTQLVIQQLFANIYLNFGTEAEPDMQLIATLNPNAQIVIPAYKTEERAFDIEVKWLSLGSTALKILQNKLMGNGQFNWPKFAKIEGRVKAEGFTIPFEYTVPFNSEPIEK